MAAMRLRRGESFSVETRAHEKRHRYPGRRLRYPHQRWRFQECRAGGRMSSAACPTPSICRATRSSRSPQRSDMLEFASCWVPTDQDFPTQLVTPDMSAIELRGGGNASRQINGILPPGFNCHRIVAVEVYTPSGNWSSYPPHKHDVHVEDAKMATCWKRTWKRSTSTRSIIPAATLISGCTMTTAASTA